MIPDLARDRVVTGIDHGTRPARRREVHPGLKIGEVHPALGQFGWFMLLVYVTTPNAGANTTWMRPVVLKPCELERETTLVRTRIGALPGCAWISTAFWENGWACATSVTEAEGTYTTMANSPTAKSVAAAT